MAEMGHGSEGKRASLVAPPCSRLALNSGPAPALAPTLSCVPCMDGARGARGIRRFREWSGAVMYSAYCCSRSGRWP